MQIFQKLKNLFNVDRCFQKFEEASDELSENMSGARKLILKLRAHNNKKIAECCSEKYNLSIDDSQRLIGNIDSVEYSKMSAEQKFDATHRTLNFAQLCHKSRAKFVIRNCLAVFVLFCLMPIIFGAQKFMMILLGILSIPLIAAIGCIFAIYSLQMGKAFAVKMLKSNQYSKYGSIAENLNGYSQANNVGSLLDVMRRDRVLSELVFLIIPRNIIKNNLPANFEDVDMKLASERIKKCGLLHISQSMNNVPDYLSKKYNMSFFTNSGDFKSGYLTTIDFRPSFWRTTIVGIYSKMIIPVAGLFLLMAVRDIVFGGANFAVMQMFVDKTSTASIALGMAATIWSVIISILMTAGVIGWACVYPAAPKILRANQSLVDSLNNPVSKLISQNPSIAQESALANESWKKRVQNAQQDKSPKILVGHALGLFPERGISETVELGMPVVQSMNDRAQHTIVMGATGSGKTVRVVVPTVREYEGRATVFLWDDKLQLGRELGAKIISPSAGEFNFNPLEDLSPMEAAQVINDVFVARSGQGGKKGGDHFDELAIKILVALLSMMNFVGMAYTIKNLALSFKIFVEREQWKDSDVISESKRAEMEAIYSAGVAALDDEGMEFNANLLIHELPNSGEDHLGSVKMTVMNRLGDFLQSAALAPWASCEKSTLSMKYLVESKQIYAIELPRKDVGAAFDTFRRLFSERIYKYMSTHYEPGENGMSKHLVLEVIDEAQKFLTESDLENQSTARQFGLSYLYAMQSLAQLKDRIGGQSVDKLFSITSTVIALKIQESFSAEVISKILPQRNILQQTAAGAIETMDVGRVIGNRNGYTRICSEFEMVDEMERGLVEDRIQRPGSITSISNQPLLTEREIVELTGRGDGIAVARIECAGGSLYVVMRAAAHFETAEKTHEIIENYKRVLSGEGMSL